MSITYPALFTTIIFITLSLEGFGIEHGHELAYFFIIFTIPALFIHMVFRERNLIFPKKTGLIFLLFLGSQFISSIFSINTSQSIMYFLFSLSSFLAYLCVYNYRSQFSHLLNALVFSLSFLFILYSLILNLHILNLFIPESGFQFVYSSFATHNHLGDFLVLPFVISLYYIYLKRASKFFYLLPAILAPFVLISYSRSSYLAIGAAAFFIHVFYLHKKHSLSYKIFSRILMLFLVLLTVFLVVGTTTQGQRQQIFFTFNNFLVHKEGLQTKEMLGNRPEYYREAFAAISKNPILGVGPNNFLTISLQYSKNPSQEATQSTHNIFIETAVGQGLLGAMLFTGLILFIILKSEKKALYFAFLAMLVNFQTDYTYQIYSFLLLFFMLAGVISNEKPSTLSFRRHPKIHDKA